MTKRFGALGVAFWGALGAAACTHQDVEIHALPDGTKQLSCMHTLPQCLSHVDDVCKGNSYEILYAIDTQKIYGSDNESQVESRTSSAVVHCLGPHQKRMTDGVASAGAPASLPAIAPLAPNAAPPSVAAAARACVPGATQSCVGAGACAGGQACLADGSGFGPCDCGAPKASP
ncbi:MAG TPA: hypothetical protein VGQ57_06015 [Polyangiaceae bacterium]|nr:hypothetical protein [Polyangiaceae bacterium]